MLKKSLARAVKGKMLKGEDARTANCSSSETSRTFNLCTFHGLLDGSF